MGTRNLTAVVVNGEYKVAQYGQWDGDPSGQGTTALKFLKSKARREKLKKKLLAGHVSFVSETELQEAYRRLGVEGEQLTEVQGEAFIRMFPYLTRNHGAEVLGLITESTSKKIKLRDNINFAAESLFCEWAYVVDFDKNTFEVYTGFNTQPLPEAERFSYLPIEDEEQRKTVHEKVYYPVKHVKTYSLDELPGVGSFVDEIIQLTRTPEEEEDASQEAQA